MKVLSKWSNQTHKKNYLQDLILSEKLVAKEYSKNDSLGVGDFISHPKFGFGFVLNVISKTKVGIFFEGSEKIMLQNWQLS
ncbi:MAG: hypothetical protein KC478_15375 [Bacteriovoracaceae bacterium]|nr:hypothetical protein [Bacteriovoracaceae bacterium]